MELFVDNFAGGGGASTGIEMTDNEIIKALECCSDYKNTEACEQCPFTDKECATTDRLDKYALDLINRQKAEIERLQIRNKTLTEITKNYDWKFEKAKSEAIKEFAERLREKASSCVTSTNGHEIYETKSYTIMATTLDNLVKEMVGDDNG